MATFELVKKSYGAKSNRLHFEKHLINTGEGKLSYNSSQHTTIMHDSWLLMIYSFLETFELNVQKSEIQTILFTDNNHYLILRCCHFLCGSASVLQSKRRRFLFSIQSDSILHLCKGVQNFRFLVLVIVVVLGVVHGPEILPRRYRSIKQQLPLTSHSIGKQASKQPSKDSPLEAQQRICFLHLAALQSGVSEYDVCTYVLRTYLERRSREKGSLSLATVKTYCQPLTVIVFIVFGHAWLTLLQLYCTLVSYLDRGRSYECCCCIVNYS